MPPWDHSSEAAYMSLWELVPVSVELKLEFDVMVPSGDVEMLM